MLRQLAPAAIAATLALAGAAAAQAPAGTSPMVDEAVRAAEQAQQADKQKVDRMSQDAARAAEGVPSGAETVGSTAAPAQSAGRATAAAGPGGGLSAQALIGREIADREGRPVGKVADVMIAAESGGTMVLVETNSGGQVRGVTAARLLPGGDGGGYRVDLDRAGVDALPGFARDGDVWRLRE